MSKVPFSPRFVILKRAVIAVLLILLNDLILNLLQRSREKEILIRFFSIPRTFYLISPLRRIHIAQLLLQIGKSTARLIHDEVQLSIFGVIFVKFSLIFATLFDRDNGRVITAGAKQEEEESQRLKDTRASSWNIPEAALSRSIIGQTLPEAFVATARHHRVI